MSADFEKEWSKDQAGKVKTRTLDTEGCGTLLGVCGDRLRRAPSRAERIVIGVSFSEAPALPPRICCSGHVRFRAHEQMAASPGGLAWRSALPAGAE